MSSRIDYGKLMYGAMRGLIQKVLEEVAAHGLPGAHHFFVTFDTRHPDVRIASWLRSRYPDEMTVVIQHWFAGLEVTDEGFSVTLNFGDSPEPLYIPFDALRTFVDPSVEFGLRFDSHDATEDEAPIAIDVEEPESPPAARGEAQIVSLDKFRK